MKITLFNINIQLETILIGSALNSQQFSPKKSVKRHITVDAGSSNHVLQMLMGFERLIGSLKIPCGQFFTSKKCPENWSLTINVLCQNLFPATFTIKYHQIVPMALEENTRIITIENTHLTTRYFLNCTFHMQRNSIKFSPRT